MASDMPRNSMSSPAGQQYLMNFEMDSADGIQIENDLKEQIKRLKGMRRFFGLRKNRSLFEGKQMSIFTSAPSSELSISIRKSSKLASSLYFAAPKSVKKTGRPKGSKLTDINKDIIKEAGLVRHVEELRSLNVEVTEILKYIFSKYPDMRVWIPGFLDDASLYALTVSESLKESNIHWYIYKLVSMKINSKTGECISLDFVRESSEGSISPIRKTVYFFEFLMRLLEKTPQKSIYLLGNTYVYGRLLDIIKLKILNRPSLDELIKIVDANFTALKKDIDDYPDKFDADLMYEGYWIKKFVYVKAMLQNATSRAKRKQYLDSI